MQNELSATVIKWLALICLSLAVAIGCWSFTVEARFLLVFPSSKTVSYAPDFKSGLLSLAILLPLYSRQILRWDGFTMFSIFGFVLTWAVSAVFVQILVGGEVVWTQFGFRIPNVSFVALCVLVALVWLGMRGIAALAGAMALVLVAFNLLNSSIMGVFGFLFLGLGFIGIILQNRIPPTETIKVISQEWGGDRPKIALDGD